MTAELPNDRPQEFSHADTPHADTPHAATSDADTPHADDQSRVSDALATIVVHGGGPEHAGGRPVVTPLVQSVNFVYDGESARDMRYTRYGNTPNALVVQRKMAMLEGSEAALVLSSGMGATSCAMLALLRPGDHMVASSWLYGGTRELFEKEFPMLGIDVSFVDPTETRTWRRSLRPTTRALFLESPVNPTTRVIDLAPLRALSQEHGLAFVVDSTFASPMNFRALEHGADVVIHSGTKYLNGHHDSMSGVVCGTQSVIDEVREKMMRWGQAPDPFAVWLLERGLKTLDIRVKRQSENAMRVAQWAEQHGAFASVLYPGLESHPDHDVATRVLDGFGGMLGLVLRGGDHAATRVVPRLRLFLQAPSLGGVDSLVSEPRSTSHSHISREARAAIGISDGFLRLSVGIEDADDLIADLSNAVDGA